MFIEITGIDLIKMGVWNDWSWTKMFMNITGMIYLIKMWVWHLLTFAQMFMDINSIDLFDQNVSMAWLQLDSDVYGYQ